MEDFDKIEFELLQEHERIIEKRKALLGDPECFHNIRKSAVATPLWDSNKARQRNIKLNQRLTEAANELNRKLEKYSQESKLDVLKKHYWTTVSSLFPAWYQEFQQFGGTHEQQPSTKPPHGSSSPPEKLSHNDFKSLDTPSSQATKTDAKAGKSGTAHSRFGKAKSRSETDEVRMESDDSPVPSSKSSSEGEYPMLLPESVHVKTDATSPKAAPVVITDSFWSKRRKKAARFNI